MPLPGTPHTAKIAVGWTYVGTAVQAENIFYLEDTSDTIFVDPALTCATVLTAVVAQLVPHHTPEVLFNQIGFEDVRTVPFGGILVGNSPHAGTLATTGTSLPTSVCLAVKKATANLSRSGRGRWYYPVGNGSEVASADIVSSAFATGAVSALSAFQAAVEAALAPAKMGIVSYQSNKVLRTAGLFQQIVNWSTVDNTIDSQRRRLLGRGR